MCLITPDIGQGRAAVIVLEKKVPTMRGIGAYFDNVQAQCNGIAQRSSGQGINQSVTRRWCAVASVH